MLLLSGCHELSSTKPLYLPIDSETKVLLSKEHVRWMHQADYQRLLRFVATAQPKETMQWKSRTTTYTLTSQSIFLNDSGQPCRCYQFKRQSFLTKLVDRVETACRNIKGNWVRIHPSPYVA